MLKLAATLLALTTLVAAQKPEGHHSPLGKPYVYRTVEGHALSLYVAQPPDNFKGPRPALVTIHGGGFTAGGPQSFNPQSEYALARGMVTVEVQYRLVGKEAKGVLDCARDTRAAMRWVRAHSAELNIDPNRIVGMGGSAGGYLTAADAFLDGPNDPADDLKLSPAPNVVILFNPALNAEPGAVMAKSFPNPADAVAYSPYLHIPQKPVPTQILSGLADTTVGVDDIVDYARRLKRAGANVDLELYPAQVHAFFNKEPYTTATLIAVDHFLRPLGYMEGPPPPPMTLAPDMQPRNKP